ncbi:hypothetical protein Nepgr_009189 [Nepenthes gracilis]|uniref:Coiled-coil domain-containing protein R3HCC1L n=1 Tax=Nepenthes gracilis TaxID=150966 RepID=A0AAD3XK01_NEPGR|nr:hypothetical protein Nepgr_009189 [Nepenthes gracilis]
MEGGEENWSEKVEDLLESGDIEAAVCLLENLISKLETFNSSNSEPQLASALFQVAKLYDSQGLSLKADEVRSRASILKNHFIFTPSLPSQSSDTVEVSKKESVDVRVSLCDDLDPSNSSGDCFSNERNSELRTQSPNDLVLHDGNSDDDWEAVAERAPDELLSLPGVSKLSLEDAEEERVQRRRGRGTFSSYGKHGLYSDQQSDEPIACDPHDDTAQNHPRENTDLRTFYGTRHVLVLEGFQPSTRTTDLEKLLLNFKDHGFVIRWIRDTVALAVFRTPSLALEACNSVHCSFSVRVLEEDDIILSSISIIDLEPPRQRPKTSARTAHRLIAQSMGVKMPSSTFGSRELKKQEAARRNRIVTRQILKDDAWGPDDIK